MKIIADISGNHGGFLEKACELIEVAADCGCDYAKFQYYSPREMFDSGNEALYAKLMVPHNWIDVLFDTARDSGIGLFASVFSGDSVSDLVEFAPPYFKIASPQSTWLPKIVYKEIVESVPATTPIIFSTDSRDYRKMADVIGDHEAFGLYCPAGHPPILRDADFDAFWSGAYDGLSDHSSGLEAPLAFARVGATIIEKHLKLDDNCVDAAFSATPQTMANLCRILK